MQFIDQAFARRLESAEEIPQVDCARMLQKLRPEIGADFAPICGGHVMFAGLNSPIGHAAGLGFEGPVTAADLDRLGDDRLAGDDAPDTELGEGILDFVSQTGDAEALVEAGVARVYIDGEMKDSGYARVQLEQFDIARRMIAMVQELNRANFGGGRIVTCPTG